MRKIWFIIIVLGIALLVLLRYQNESGDITGLAPGASQGGSGSQVFSATESSAIESQGAEDNGRRRVVARGTGDGAPLEIELIEPVSTMFSPGNWTESDRAYAEILDELPFVDYDPDLGHAARELAHLYSLEDILVPSDALAFLTTSAGATVWTVRQSFTATSQEGTKPILDRVRGLIASEPDDGRPIRVGIGEAYEIGATPPRTIAILLSRSDLYLDPIPRRIEPGQSLVVSGSLPREATASRVLVMGPDGEIHSDPLETEGERFRAVVDAGSLSGPLWVELVATLPSGPMPLAQLELQVGGVLPKKWNGHYPPDESMIGSVVEAERVAEALINMDRKAYGLSPLLRDPVLDRIARNHSDDMAMNRFFGHRSPSTGMAGDRLRRAEYRSALYGENVALNRSLWSAETGLMYSLGHRQNLLSRRHTHMGIGVHMKEKNGVRRYHLTQLFARPPVPIDVDEGREQLYRMISRAWEKRGWKAPRRNDALTRVAVRYARRSDPAIGEALEQAREGAKGMRGLYGWAHRVSDLTEMSIPEDAFASRYRWIGIGVGQNLESPPPTIQLVILFGE